MTAITRAEAERQIISIDTQLEVLDRQRAGLVRRRDQLACEVIADQETDPDGAK